LVRHDNDLYSIIVARCTRIPGIRGGLTAQDRSPAILNAVEVQQLVKRAEPADQARLSAHFSALADRYTAEVKRHKSMSQAFVGRSSTSCFQSG